MEAMWGMIKAAFAWLTSKEPAEYRRGDWWQPSVPPPSPPAPPAPPRGDTLMQYVVSCNSTATITGNPPLPQVPLPTLTSNLAKIVFADGTVYNVRISGVFPSVMFMEAYDAKSSPDAIEETRKEWARRYS